MEDYSDKWNNYIKSQNGKNYASDQILAGIRVQKDFYGNGYTINMHNLTYPSEEIVQVIDGNTISIPTLGKNDLFRGPLPFYALGDPNNMPLVKAFGQDNIGMYVDGDDITINDVNLKNCDFGNMVSNLNTTGTVLETHGNNITIVNSRLSNGKNIVRSFSSMNTVIKNTLLSNSRNFLINGSSVATIKNGTMEAKGDYSSGAYGTVRTEGAANVTLKDLTLYNYRGNGLNIKACSGTKVDISDTVVYSQYGGGIEAAGGEIELTNVTVDQKGMYAAPYNSMAISVNGGGVVTVNSGYYRDEEGRCGVKK